MKYLIALGGNLGDTKQIFEAALNLIERKLGTIEKKSLWHVTQPLLHPQCPVLGQRNYLNGLILLRSSLEPQKLLTELLAIEQELGRVRTQAAADWGPRVIDLDIIAAEDLVLNLPSLMIPHPQMHLRSFVLEPMLEVAPEWVHPVLGKTASEMLCSLRE